MTTTPLPPLPENTPHLTRRIRACESEVPAQVVLEHAMQAYATAARADLEAENSKLREALERAELFIDEVRQDLHHERITDWYPEGANSSAATMSESMRVIANRCADFEASADLENRA